MAELPLPDHFDPGRTGDVWRVPYQDRATEAEDWAARHALGAATHDEFRVGLLLVDVQNTFCIPGFELFVAGASGHAAVDDSRRLCDFIYRNLGSITQTVPSLDTHHAMQIFHAAWLVDADGNRPDPMTLVTAQDAAQKRWRVDPQVARAAGVDPAYAQRHLEHYTRQLAERGKYDLTVWPYHAMLGGIGHALVSSVEEAVFFHGLARRSAPRFCVKGELALTEHYSMLGPEVTKGPDGEAIGATDHALVETLLGFDAVIVAGQAKSHCLAWTIDDLLAHHSVQEGQLAERTYLLEDCTSPIVVPGVVDYTGEADAAFERFAAAGMHVVRSTDPIDRWPGIAPRAAR
jgi:nicotinamidase-related amidase